MWVRVLDILRALLRFLGRGIYMIAALVVVLWLLSAFGILLPLPVLIPKDAFEPLNALLLIIAAAILALGARRFAAAANADSPEWRERFAFMGLPEGARSWRGRLALHLGRRQTPGTVCTGTRPRRPLRCLPARRSRRSASTRG